MRLFLQSLQSLSESPEIPMNYPSLSFAYSASGESVATGTANGVVSVIRFNSNEPPKLSSGSLADITTADLGGIRILDAQDNIAPIYYKGVTLGGNHGYNCSAKNYVGHDKDFVDCGSVWTNGAVQIVLYGINGDYLYFITRSAINSNVPAGTYTHVSGATNTSDLDFNSGIINTQLAQSYGYRTVSLSIDGVSKDTGTSQTYVCSNAKITETYDILERLSIVEYMITQVGGSTSILVVEGDSEVRITNEYTFDGQGAMVVYYKLEALVELIDFWRILGLQNINEISSGGVDKWYIPKVLPYTDSFDSYDWANLESYKDIIGSTDISNSRTEPTGYLSDRMLQIVNTKNAVFKQGVLPVKDGLLRRTLTNVACSVSNAEKHYMRYVQNSSTGTNLPLGSVYEFVGYKGISPTNADRTDYYFIPDFETDEIYMYADWHQTINDALPIPTEWQGRAFTILEKSSNISVNSSALGATLDVIVDNSLTYGYLIIKIV